jgi:hypothetical protein
MPTPFTPESLTGETLAVDTVNGVAWGGLFLLENEGRLVNMIPVGDVLLNE